MLNTLNRTSLHWVLMLTVLALAFFPRGVNAQCGPRFLGAFPTPSESNHGLILNEDLGYFAGEENFRVVDISDPSEPRLLGQIPERGLGNLDISNDLVYAVASGSLKVLDVSDPSQPERIGQFFLSGIADVQVVDQLAYVMSSNGVLLVLDISDPTEPTEVGSLELLGAGLGVFVVEGLAYTATATHGLEVIDVSDPSSPRRIGDLDTPGFVHDVRVESGFAYLAAGNSLLVVDVANPADPEVIGSIPAGGDASGLSLAGEICYLVSGTDGVVAVNVSDPRKPVILNAIRTSERANELFVDDNTLAVSVGDCCGVLLYDIRRAQPPAVLSYLDTPGTVRDIAIDGRFAYIADGSFGIHIVDISDQSKPFIASSVSMPNSTNAIGASGNTALVISNFGRLVSLDVSDPTNPMFLDELHLGGAGGAISIMSDHVFVANNNGLRIVSIANPAQLELIGEADTPWSASDVAVAGTFAYIADGQGGLRIFDIMDVADPVFIGGVEDISITQLAIVGDIIAAISKQAGLAVYDITNPRAPSLLTTRQIPNRPRGIDVEGRTVVVATGDGVEVMSMWDALHPEYLGSSGMLRRTTTATLDQGIGIVGNGSEGFAIMDFESCTICPADLDGDTDADADDFFLYLDAFAAGDFDICDIDADNDCDAEDVFAYLDLFAQPCE